MTKTKVWFSTRAVLWGSSEPSLFYVFLAAYLNSCSYLILQALGPKLAQALGLLFYIGVSLLAVES